VKDYHVNIFYSEEDEGYIADIPDLKYCSAFGETPLEALKQLKIAKELWLETAKATGKTIPEPRYKPDIYKTRVAAIRTAVPVKKTASSKLKSCQRPVAKPIGVQVGAAKKAVKIKKVSKAVRQS
jgi:predicted RNase H-like HicB family nuclease